MNIKTSTAVSPPGVVCYARRVYDGWTGQQTGWMYGGHIISGEAPEHCPNCGERLRPQIPPPSTRSSEP